MKLNLREMLVEVWAVSKVEKGVVLRIRSLKLV